MSRRALLAACVVGVAVLACGRVHAASDYDFGMALMTKFGFDEEAEKFFSGLQQGTNRAEQLTGSFGLGGIKKLRADRADDPAKAARLYVDAKKLISEFLRDSANSHPDRGAANAALVDIEKRYLSQLKRVIKDPAASEDARGKALREAKDIFIRLLGPLREDKVATKASLKKQLPLPEPPRKPSKKFNKALEAAFNAMVRYVSMAIEEAELYDRTSKKRKDTALALAKELTDDRGFYDEHELQGVVLRLYYEIGRAYVAAGDLKKADESFKELLEYEPWGVTDPNARAWIQNLQLYAFFKKAEAYFDAENWDKTIKIVDDMFGTLPQALNEDQGNKALLFKAEALFRKDPPDYAGAIREATKVIEKGKGFWPNDASQLMAKVLEAMKHDAQSVAMSPEILHGVAVGEVQLAYRERDPSKRQAHFEKAIYWLQKTITATRAEGVKFETRIEHGPTAWFQLGIIYSKMGLWYEARFSFEAVLRYYAKDVVGRMLADRPTYAERVKQIEKDIEAKKILPKEGEVLNKYVILFEKASEDRRLKGLLTALDVQLDKSANNFMVSARRRHNESKSQFDAERLDEAIKIQIAVNPDTAPRQDFNLGLLDRKAAEGHLKAKRHAKAVDKYESAYAYFMKSAKGLKSTREDAYHLAGMAYYQVMSELGKPEIQKTLPALAKRAPEFGEKALEAFAAFMAEAAKHTDPVPAEKKKRDGRIATIDVARPVIYMALGRFKEAVAAADEFLVRETRTPEHVPTVMLTRVRALREIAVKALGTAAETEALDNVVKAADDIKDVFPKFNELALNLKAAVFNAAEQKLKELAEKAEDPEKSAFLARADEYSRKNAQFTKDLIALRPNVTLEFLISVATQFYEQKAYAGARDLYVNRILKEFDPNGTGEKMVIAEDVFEAAAKSARLGDFKNETALKKARGRIKALKEFVFGEPIEERRDRRWKGVIHPSKKMNWSKAYKETVAILTEAPRLTSKPELEKIRDELIFRIRMMTVKLNLADCDMALARKLAVSKPDEARKLFEEAAGHVKKVREYYWRDNELRFLEAEAYENIGKLQEAQELYIEASRHSPEDSPSRHRARVAFSKVTLGMAGAEKDPDKAEKLFRKAGNYAYAIINTSESEDTWKKVWPEAKDFLAKCDAGIVALGEKVIDTEKLAKLEDVEGYSREVSANDQKLHVQIKIVKERIRTGEADPDKENEALKEAFEVHLGGLPDKALDTITGQQKQGALKKAAGDVARRTFFVRFLYQSPFKDYVLRRGAVGLGVLDNEDDPIPVRLFSEKALKAAKGMGYITKDGKLVPRGELPESDRELLRKELDAVEEEAPEDGAAPAPVPEEGAVGTDAVAPAEEVAP